MPAKFPIKALLASALLLGVSQRAAAASYQWDANGATAGLGGGGTYNPTSATAWDLIGDALDAGADTVVASNNAADSYYFGGLSGSGTAGTINNNGGYGFAGSVYFTLAGYTLADTSANGDITFAKMVTVGGSGTTTFAATGAGFGDFKFNGGLTVNSGATAKIGVRANATNAISSVASLTGAGNVTFYGSNIHRLSGTNTTFTGTARLEGATLQLMNYSALAGGTLEYVGGALSFNAGTGTYNLGGLTGTSSITLNGNTISVGASNADTAFSGSILIGTGGGGVTKVGTGVLTLSSSGSTYSGATTVTDGALLFSSGSLGAGTISMNGGILRWASGNTQDISARLGLVSGKVAQLDTNGNDVTLASGFGGSTTGSLTKLGSGVLTLSGTSNYTGATTVSAGRLNLTGSLTSAISVNAGSITGSGSTTGSLTTTGGTTFLLAGGATTTGLTANGVTFGASTALDFAVTPNLGTTYDVVTYGAGGLTGLSNLTILIRGTLTNTGTKLTFATPAAFVTRTWSAGSGTWSINGAANFAEGDQKFFNTDHVVFGDLVADTTVTLSGLLRPTSVTASNGAGTYTLSGTSGSAEITGSTALTKSGAGTFVLASAHSYSGGTTVNAGTLQLGAGGSGAGFATNGSYTVNAGGALRIYQGSGAIVAPTWASIAGAGILALNKDGAGLTNKDWGTASLGAGFTGTLWVEEGRVSTATGASLGGATAVVIEDGAQLGTWAGGTFSPNLTIAGTGYGETNYEVAIRGGNGGITSIFSGNVALAASAALGAGPSGFLQVDGAVTGAAGAALTVGTSGALTGTVQLNGNNTYAGNTVIAAGTLKVGSAGKLGAGAYAGNIANAGTFLYSSSSAQTLSGSISGAGALTKDTSSSGKLTLSGANSYSGVTTVTAGELVISGSSSGASRFIVQGAAADSPVLTISAGAGAINTSASAAFLVAGAANTTGTVNMAGGTLTANHELWLGDASSTANGKFYLTGGTVEVKNWTAVGRSGVGLLEISGGLWKNTTAGNFAIGTGTGGNNSGVVNVKGTGVLEVIGRTLSIRESLGANSQGTLNLSEAGVVKATTVSFGLNSAAIAGTGNLNISGGNLWTNTINRPGTNTTANISLSGGTLGALDADATWSVAMALSGGTTTFAARDFAGTARTLNVTGALSGAGALSKSGNGTLTLSVTNTYTGGTTVDAGILNLSGGGGATGTIRGTATVNAGATLRLSATDVTGYNTDATRLSTINLVGGTLDVNTTGNQTLGSATVNMTGAAITGIANSNIDFFGGASALNSLASSTTSTISGAQLSLNRQGATTVTVAAGTTASGVDLEISSVIRNSANGDAAGTLTKAGNGWLRLTGVNTSNHALAIAAGTLEVGGAGSLGSGNFGATISNAGSLVFSTSANQTLSAAVSGSGSLTKTGNGTLTLNAANTYTGNTTVNGGKVVLARADALDAGSAVALGASGTVVLGYSLAGNSTFSNALTGTGMVDLATSGAYTLTLSGLSGFGGSVKLSTGTFDATASNWSGNIIFAGGALAGGLSGYSGAVTVSGTTLSAASGLPANVTLAAGGTIDFSGATGGALTTTIQFAGGALSNASGFTGNLNVVGANVTIAPGSIGGGTLILGSGASVNITGALGNAVTVTGGSITGGQNLTGAISLNSGTFKVGATAGQAGIDQLNASATLTVGGGTLDLNNSTATNTINFASGSLSNAALFAGTLNVLSSATLTNDAGSTLGGATIVVDASGRLTNNGTVTGAVTVGQGGTLAGSGTFEGVTTVAPGGVLSPGNSPGVQTFNASLVLQGGSVWQQQIYNWTADGTLPTGDAAGNHVGARAYDTINLSTELPGLGGYPALDLSDAAKTIDGQLVINPIILRLMSLAHWEDNFGSQPIDGNMAFVRDASGEWIPKDFVIATYIGHALIGDAASISAVFAFDTTGFYDAAGVRVLAGSLTLFEDTNSETGVTKLTLRAVPEPSTYGAILAGLALAAAAVRRRRR